MQWAPGAAGLLLLLSAAGCSLTIPSGQLPPQGPDWFFICGGYQKQTYERSSHQGYAGQVWHGDTKYTRWTVTTTIKESKGFTGVSLPSGRAQTRFAPDWLNGERVRRDPRLLTAPFRPFSEAP